MPILRDPPGRGTSQADAGKNTTQIFILVLVVARVNIEANALAWRRKSSKLVGRCDLSGILELGADRADLSGSSTMTSTRREQVAATIQQIKDFYDVGRQLPPKQPHGEVLGQHIIDGEAARLGMNPDTVRKARQFADPEAGYAREELDELCRLIRDVQTKQSTEKSIFGRTNLVRLLTVPRHRRAAFQREAVENGWSVRELEAEIARRFGTRRAGGRRRRTPHDTAELLTQIEHMAETWRRWQAELDRLLEDEERKALPGTIEQQLRAIGPAMRSLQETVLTELQTIRPSRQARELPEADAAAQGERQPRRRTSRGEQ